MSVIQPHFGAISISRETSAFVHDTKTPKAKEDKAKKAEFKKKNLPIPCCICKRDIFTYTKTISQKGLPITPGPGPYDGTFVCQEHRSTIGHLKNSLADRIFGNNKKKTQPDPDFTRGISDEFLNDEVRKLLFLFAKYRNDRENSGDLSKDKLWNDILKPEKSRNFLFFRDEIEKFVAEWYSNNPGSGDVMFDKMKEHFGSATDEDIQGSLVRYRARLRSSNRSIPADFWSNSLHESHDLNSFEEKIMHEQTTYELSHPPPAPIPGGLGRYSYAKGLFRAPGSPRGGGLGGQGLGKGFHGFYRNAPRGESPAESSSAEEEEEEEEMEEELPHYSPRYPPPSPSGSASQSSQFGAPAEAFESLRL
jgi:hypothetical protein